VTDCLFGGIIFTHYKNASKYYGPFCYQVTSEPLLGSSNKVYLASSVIYIIVYGYSGFANIKIEFIVTPELCPGFMNLCNTYCDHTERDLVTKIKTLYVACPYRPTLATIERYLKMSFTEDHECSYVQVYPISHKDTVTGVCYMLFETRYLFDFTLRANYLSVKNYPDKRFGNSVTYWYQSLEDSKTKTKEVVTNEHPLTITHDLRILDVTYSNWYKTSYVVYMQLHKNSSCLNHNIRNATQISKPRMCGIVLLNYFVTNYSVNILLSHDILSRIYEYREEYNSYMQTYIDFSYASTSCKQNALDDIIDVYILEREEHFVQAQYIPHTSYFYSITIPRPNVLVKWKRNWIRHHSHKCDLRLRYYNGHSTSHQRRTETPCHKSGIVIGSNCYVSFTSTNITWKAAKKMCK